MSPSPDVPRRLPIQAEARAILTNPQLAAQAGPLARRLAWMIEANARGHRTRQAHRPASIQGGRTDG